MPVLASGYFSDPMRNWTGYMPARSDGSGVVRIDMRSGNAQYFKLSQLPSPKDHGIQLPGSQVRLIAMPSRRRGASNGSYRIAYEEFPGHKKPHMARFRLSSAHTLDTLQVLTKHLDEVGVDWLYIANEHGNPVSRSCFRSSSVYGGGGGRS